jgi:hypothetical protein
MTEINGQFMRKWVPSPKKERGKFGVNSRGEDNEDSGGDAARMVSSHVSESLRGPQAANRCNVRDFAPRKIPTRWNGGQAGENKPA